MKHSDESETPQAEDRPETPPVEQARRAQRTLEDLLRRIPHRPPWGPWRTLLFLGMILFAALATDIVVSIIVLAATGAVQNGEVSREIVEQTIGLHYVIAALAHTPVVLAAVAWLTHQRGWSARDYIGWHRVPLLRLLLWLGALALFIPAEEAFLRYVATDAQAEIFSRELVQTSPNLVLLVLATVIAAPLAEEIVFRGFLWRGYVHLPEGPVGAILVSAALWAVIHIQYGAVGIGIILAAGLLFGTARYFGKSVLVPIVMHVAMNAYWLAVSWLEFRD